MRCVATHPHRSFWIPIRAPIRAASFSTCRCLERALSTGLRRNIAEPKPDHLAPTAGPNPFGSDFDEVLQARRDEAEEFYKAITPAFLNADEANVMRQALAGMLRSKHIRKPDPTLRILVNERKVGNDPALSKVNRHCDCVAVGTLSNALPGWDPTIEWYGNILVVRRVFDEVGLSATGAIPPNDRPGGVQIQVIVQHLASVQHSPRIE
jgi:hypothetical protein